MKKGFVLLAITIAMLLAQGCGVTESISENCQGSDLEMSCNGVFGSRDNQQDAELDRINAEIAKLGITLNGNITEINNLNQQLTNLYFSDTAQTQTTAELETRISALQISSNALLAQMALYSSRETIVGFVDPCGDQPGFDEVLIRTSSGHLVAYFQQGGNRFLSFLVPGFYQTTDGHRCDFTVNSQMKVCNNQGCQ
jgi:hypothetical protein